MQDKQELSVFEIMQICKDERSLKKKPRKLNKLTTYVKYQKGLSKENKEGTTTTKKNQMTAKKSRTKQDTNTE